jgi:hypothetical protein
MDRNILLKLPAPFHVIETLRITGSTNRETQILSTVKYFRSKKYSETFIDSQLKIIGYYKDEIKRAIQKIK